MRQLGIIALARIVTAWILAGVTSWLALDRLFGVPRFVVIGVAVAIAMFINDTANIDPLFPRARRVWLMSGALRAFTALIGVAAIMSLSIVAELSAGRLSTLFGAIIGGLAIGGLAGTIAREIRAALKAKREAPRK